MARLVAILALACAFTHGNRAQAQLTLLRSFSTEATIDRGPDGIAYHPDEDELYAVDSSNATLYRLTTDGELLDSWANPELAFYEGIGTLPDGNLVVADGGMGTLTVFTPDLLMVQAPLDLTQVSAAPNGIVMVEETDTLFITDDNVLQIMEIDINGQLLGQLTTTEIEPSFLEPEGIAYEPVSGHLLAVDDDQAKLYEITQDGELVREVDLEALTGFSDPEGLSYHAPTQTLYIAFDSDGQVGIFHFEPIDTVVDTVFRRGDCNDDGSVDISDPINTLEMLFLGTFEITCYDACDSNDDGTVGISDVISSLGVLFLGNAIFPPPGFVKCGIDPTPDEIGCETPPTSCRL